MGQIKTARAEANLPLNLFLSDSTGPVAGATVVVAIRDGATTNSYLDFADGLFKTTGWTTRQAALTGTIAGVYPLAGGLDVSAIGNLPASTTKLLAEYEITNPAAVRGIASDTILIEEIAPTAAQVNAEMVDVMAVDTHPEITSIPGAVSSFRDRQGLIFAKVRNKLIQDGDAQTLRNDADTADIGSATVTKLLGITTRYKWV